MPEFWDRGFDIDKYKRGESRCLVGINRREGETIMDALKIASEANKRTKRFKKLLLDFENGVSIY